MTSPNTTAKAVQAVDCTGFDHLHFWVGNAFQAAAYYITRLGFEPYAYRGLETGSRSVTTQVLRQDGILFAFSSALQPDNLKISTFLARHGDGVHDVALRVKSCSTAYNAAMARGATSISPPTTKTDANGTITTATVNIGVVPDLMHTFVERGTYSGFLPGYELTTDDTSLLISGNAGLQHIDHVVTNMGAGELEGAVRAYERVFGWHRFWSIDDSMMHTEYSALNSIVVTDPSESIRMPINEPAPGRRKSQIQEFVEFYGGNGVQHIALHCTDICAAVDALQERGMVFITVPDSYYDDLRKRLAKSPVTVATQLGELQKRGVLVDFDDTGYLLQIFTKPLQDRPTLFVEVIQRCGHDGFGAGNFKSLFEAIEREQAKRGNL